VPPAHPCTLAERTLLRAHIIQYTRQLRVPLPVRRHRTPPVHSHATQETVNLHAVAHDVADPSKRRTPFAVNYGSTSSRTA